MNDILEQAEPDEQQHIAAQPNGQINGAETPQFAALEDQLQQQPQPGPENMVPFVPPQNILSFVMQQLPLTEQLGFLRGNIMLLAARIGTGEADPRDGERLNEMNFLFQLRLREMIQQNTQQQEKMQADMHNMRMQADADARTRGFKDSDDMGQQMKTLYESITERIKQWYASTEPGGDPLTAPETEPLLYDVYRVVEGRA